jgi:hypothetical protein
VLFAFAAGLFVLPVQAKAITGTREQAHVVTVLDVEERSCPYHPQLGYVKQSEAEVPLNRDLASDYGVRLFFKHNCQVEQSNRQSGVLASVVLGLLFSLASMRRGLRALQLPTEASAPVDADLCG